MVLTSKQREDLHKSIHAYLVARGYSNAAEAFCKDSGASDDFSKVMDLEKEVSALREAPPGMMMSGGAQSKDATPRAPAMHTISGHRMPVTSVCAHPLYALLASCSEDATIKVWDLESARLERTLKGHTDAVLAIAFNARGDILASCSADLSIKLWEFQKQFTCMKTLQGHDHVVSGVLFLPNGDHLVSVSRDKSVKMWEVSSGYCVRTLKGHDEWVRCVAIDRSGALLATGSTDTSVRLWNAESGECLHTLRGHEHVVECVAVSAPYTRLIGGEGDDVSTTLSSEQSAQSYVLIASGSRDRTIRLWHSGTAQCIHVLEGHENWLRSLRFHPNNKLLISCSDDKSIRIWECSSGRNVRSIGGAHDHFVSCIDLGSAGNRLIAISGSVNNQIKIWACR